MMQWPQRRGAPLEGAKERPLHLRGWARRPGVEVTLPEALEDSESALSRLETRLRVEAGVPDGGVSGVDGVGPGCEGGGIANDGNSVEGREDCEICAR